MATRLYPQTTNQNNLEVLAGVPAGTYARLTEFKAAHPISGTQVSDDVAYENYCLLGKDEALSKLEHFLTFGWGRVHFGNGDCGSTHDEAEMRKICEAHGLPYALIPLFEGLCWN